jgi:beta-apo-4'-carotenal oxygenase
MKEVSSGSANINDSFMAASLASVPFGGVGTSGTGVYRGRSSFDTFTHRRVIAKVPLWIDSLIRVRYMPYKSSELERSQRMAAKPNFDRSGKRITSLASRLGWLVGLGAGGAKGALFRWLFVLGAAWYTLVLKKASASS